MRQLNKTEEFEENLEIYRMICSTSTNKKKINFQKKLLMRLFTDGSVSTDKLELEKVKKQRDILVEALKIIKVHHRNDWSFFIDNYLEEIVGIESE
ncbi:MULTISPECIES: hypothetical protein [Lactococcus]|uniref:Uncharacterized protein n=2 Tax=Lactococcus TaxID=1357 RepID=A0A387BJ10_9LACT|nr:MULTISPECIES: hypothetical protein [Lactococcus]AYG01329.1 hypothetical protein D7I46_09620 [Lactococcus allomyrinae]QDK70179.1 hypothetical protein FLP15_02025 [Lactococcus protaetiae]